MDTQTAIQNLQALVATLSSNITGQQGQVDALNLAISQLQGNLTTQEAADQQEIDSLQTQITTLQQSTSSNS